MPEDGRKAVYKFSLQFKREKKSALTFQVDVTILYMCIATVARNSIPIISAAVLSFLESISSVAGPSYAETS